MPRRPVIAWGRPRLRRNSWPGYIRRNGLSRSDDAQIVEHRNRRDRYLATDWSRTDGAERRPSRESISSRWDLRFQRCYRTFVLRSVNKRPAAIRLLPIELSWISLPSGLPAQASDSSQLEQDAIKVVNAWDAAWATKDAEKVAAYMAEDCEFRADPRETELKKGRAEFVNSMKRLIGAGITIQVVETHAMGGEAGTAVLQKRIDTIIINGQKREIPLAAFFRVKDGKIQEWLDMPLVTLRPPPGGPGRPGNAGAPGNQPN